MRKLVITAALLLAGGALLTTPAKAHNWVGCECVHLGAPAACMKGPIECTAAGGVCLAPCSYGPHKMMHHKKHHRHMHHKPMHHKKMKSKAKPMKSEAKPKKSEAKPKK